MRRIERSQPYVAQEVLEHLARAILSGELAPGTKLPSERRLATELGVSRVLVREAIHRLAEAGLVRVRQGAATTVNPVSEASGIAFVDLITRLGDSLPEAYRADMIERQYLNGAGLLELAARRGTDEGLAELRRFVDEDAPEDADDFLRFEQGFWLRVAAATRNVIFEAELKWWYRLVADRMPRPPAVTGAPLPARIAFHRELARRLIERDAPRDYYMQVVGPILDSLS